MTQIEQEVTHSGQEMEKNTREVIQHRRCMQELEVELQTEHSMVGRVLLGPPGAGSSDSQSGKGQAQEPPLTP